MNIIKEFHKSIVWIRDGVGALVTRWKLSGSDVGIVVGGLRDALRVGPVSAALWMNETSELARSERAGARQGGQDS